VRGASFARRIALVTALAVAVSGAAVAGITAWLTNRIALADEDARLRGAARALASELASDAENATEDIEEEAREQAPAGIAIAAYRRGVLIGGNGEIGLLTGGQCGYVGEYRTCAAAAIDGRVAVAASEIERLDAHRSALAVASAIAVTLAMLLGVLASWSIARWTAAPLERLRAAVARVRPYEPSAPQLGPDEGIAEVDALRAALAGTLDRLRASLAQAERFAGDAAHELRTPLTTIRGELELLRESRPLDSEVGIATARTVASVERLTTLVERLLVLATPIEPLAHTERVVLEEVLQDVRASLASSARERVSVEASTEITVRGDRALLGAMIGNGIDNALKFSGAEPVVLRALVQDGVAIIEVVDRGPGVAPADRERVFEQFHRTPGARASGLPGHGIGLALVAHVAALHAGRASFVDPDGSSGARLRIELPLA